LSADSKTKEKNISGTASAWLGKILILKCELWGNHDEEKIY